MRSTTLAVLAVLPLAGCEWGFVSPFSDWGNDDGWWGDTGGYNNADPYLRGSEGMSQVSSLWQSVDGLAFDDRGSMGAASMYSVNCTFETASGNINVEDPEPTEEDVIQDSNEDGNALVVVTSMRDAVRITRYTDGGANTQSTISIPGVQGVRFDGDDVVYGAQNSGCHVGWTGSDRQVRVGTLCGGFDTAPNGTVVSTSDGSVKVVTEGGSVNDLDVPGELVAWDPVHDLIYTALVGSDTVTAVQPDGDIAWTATLEGSVTTLTDMGSRGAALVGLSTTSGGRVAVLDGATGNEIAWGEASEAPTGLWASPDGSTFAARTSWNTHFIRME